MGAAMGLKSSLLVLGLLLVLLPGQANAFGAGSMSLLLLSHMELLNPLYR